MKKSRILSALLVGALSASALTGCSLVKDTSSISNKSNQSTSGKHIKIGYVVNFGSHEWYQNIIKGAEATAKQNGDQFVWADANMNLSQQITDAENLLTQGVNVLVLSPVDPKGLSTVMEEAKQKGVKVITESNPIPGAVTTIGINNLQAGTMVGKWAGDYIKSHVQGQAKVLIVGLPSQQDTRDRVTGFKQGLQESGANFQIAQEVDGKGVKDQALQVSTDAITAHKDVNVIFGINDDSALGGEQAYEEQGLDKSKLVTIGFGVEGIAGKTALTSGGPYKAGLAMFPEYVGRTMIEQAEKAAKGETLPQRTITPMTVMTTDNLSQFYTKSGNGWTINFDQVTGLLKK